VSAMRTPNIVSGTVTRRSNSQQRTPNWLKAVYAFTASLVLITVAALLFTPDHIAGEIPPCEYEDGAGQVSCYWDADTMGNGTGHDFVKVSGK
jgi:hypothetical protein